MTSPAPGTPIMSLEEYELLPPDPCYRSELSRGQLVREPPPGHEHGRTQLRLGARLEQFVRENNLGYVVTESGFVLERNPDTVRGPDAAFVAREQYGDHLPGGRPQMAPALAVEILSPSDRVASMLEKVDQYLSAGARMVWLIDPLERSASVHKRGTAVTLLREGDDLTGDDVLPGFRCRLASVLD